MFATGQPDGVTRYRGNGFAKVKHHPVLSHLEGDYRRHLRIERCQELRGGLDDGRSYAPSHQVFGDFHANESPADDDGARRKPVYFSDDAFDVFDGTQCQRALDTR